jgi:hypothetical protein
MASRNGNQEIVNILIGTGKFHSIFTSAELDKIREESKTATHPTEPPDIFEAFRRLDMYDGPFMSDEDEFDSDSDYYDSDEECEILYFEDGDFYEMDGMRYDASSGLPILPFPIPSNLDENYRALISRMFAPQVSESGSVEETPSEGHMRPSVRPNNAPSGVISPEAASNGTFYQQCSQRGRERRGRDRR